MYDGSLDSNLDPNELINQSGVLDLGSAEMTDSIVNLLSSITDFITAVSGADFLGILKALGSYLTSMVTFFKGIYDWASSRLQNLGRLLMFKENLGKNYLLYGYGVYNMPNRTNYSDGSTLTGYDYSNIFEMAGGTYNIGFLDGRFLELSQDGQCRRKRQIIQGSRIRVSIYRFQLGKRSAGRYLL